MIEISEIIEVIGEITNAEVEDISKTSFLSDYVEASIWTNNIEKNFAFYEIKEKHLETIKLDCISFLSKCAKYISAYSEVMDESDDKVWAELGHNFCMTRNGHGCGFWDGDYNLSKEDIEYANSLNLGIYITEKAFADFFTNESEKIGEDDSFYEYYGDLSNEDC